MSTERLLERVREAVAWVGPPVEGRQHPGLFRSCSHEAGLAAGELAVRFAAELSALSGTAHLVEDEAAAAKVARGIVAGHDCRRVLAWEAVSHLEQSVAEELALGGVEIVRPEIPGSVGGRASALDALDGIIVGLTGAIAALADTGTVVVASGAGRTRLASLLPPVHIALVRCQDLCPGLPEFLAAHPEAAAAGSNMVLITGPSRTADIEMTLSIGVHGPREVHVIIAGVGNDAPLASDSAL